jgi:hypothetical protein
MRLKGLRRAIGLSIICLSIVFLLWSYLPAGTLSSSFPTANGIVEISYPRFTRVGEVFELRIRLRREIPMSRATVAEGEPTKKLQPSPTSNPVDVQDESDLSHVSFRLEIPGIQVEPGGEVSQRVDSGKEAVFVWRARGEGAGLYPGELWIHLLSAPGETTKSERRLLAVPPVEIRVTNLLGMGIYQISIFGIAGFTVGILLCLDWIISVYNRTRR